MVTAVPTVATLESQIPRDQIQLDDWTTYVSAKTPKGQAAIRRPSGEISADRAQSQASAGPVPGTNVAFSGCHHVHADGDHKFA